jgi:spore maturation protein SpmA
MFGLANAATPMGLKRWALQELNQAQNRKSCHVHVSLAINTSCN